MTPHSMHNHRLWPLLLWSVLVFHLIAAPSISIDYQKSTIIQLNRSFYLAELRFNGITPPYSISYSNLRAGWAISGNYLYIPVSYFESERLNHQLHVRVTDRTGESASLFVYINVSGSQVSFSPNPQNNLRPFNEFKNQGVNIIKQTGQSDEQQVRVIKGVLINPKKGKPELPNFPTLQTSNKQLINPQQKVSTIEKYPKFDPYPIPQIQQQKSYAYPQRQISPPPYSSNDAQLPIQQRINQILYQVQKQFNEIPQLVDTSTNLITVKPIDSIFGNLPDILDLKQLIETPNPALYLSRSIQQVISSEINCQEKIAYLLQTFGITHAHIEALEAQLSRVSLTNKLGQESQDQLQKQLEKVESEYSLQRQISLNLSKKLSKGLQQLSKLYKEYNQQVIRSELSPRTPKFNQTYEKLKMFQLEGELRIEQIQMEQINIQKEKIMRQLQEAKRQYEKKQLEAQLIQRQYLVQSEQLKQAQDKLEYAQKQALYRFKGTQQYLDQLKLSYLKKQVEVTRYKSNIEASNLKQKALENDIERLQIQIMGNNERIQEKLEFQLNTTLQNLNIALPNIDLEVNRIYYRCYRAGDIELRSDGKSDFVYVMKIDEWIQYMENIYGVDKDSLLDSILNSSLHEKNYQERSVAIYPQNIFSKVWRQSLGMIEPSDLQKIFQIDFTCLKPSTLETGSGIIKFIWKNIIIVQDKEDRNKLYELKLGSCSRIETVDQVIPENGMQIFWRGNLEENGYNIYLATVF